MSEDSLLSEKDLAFAAGRGDSAALGEIYNLHIRQLWVVAQRYLSDDEEIRDVLQDAFVKIFSSIHHFHYRGRGALVSWMCRVVANQAIDHLRSQGRLKVVSLVELPDKEDVPEPDIIRLTEEELMGLIRALPDGYRTVFNLVVFERMSQKEIASLLGIKDGTVSSQFARAKKMLSRLVNDYLKEKE